MSTSKIEPRSDTTTVAEIQRDNETGEILVVWFKKAMNTYHHFTQFEIVDTSLFILEQTYEMMEQNPHFFADKMKELH